MLAAINPQRCGRVPTGIWATDEVWEKLVPMFGATRQEAQDALHIDGISSVAPRYRGPSLLRCSENEQVSCWGIRERKVPYATGVYWEGFFHPLLKK
jgi:hypothetical protein